VPAVSVHLGRRYESPAALAPAADLGEHPAMPRKPAAPADVTAERVKLNRQGYTSSGQYFGVGAPLWECYDGDRGPLYLRAGDKKAAIAQVLLRRPMGSSVGADELPPRAQRLKASRAAKARLNPVEQAIRDLTRERLELALYQIVAFMYQDYQGWNPDNEWDSDTLPNLVASIPGEVLRAIPGNEDGGE
jgi:hypothetical protein